VLLYKHFSAVLAALEKITWSVNRIHSLHWGGVRTSVMRAIFVFSIAEKNRI